MFCPDAMCNLKKKKTRAGGREVSAMSSWRKCIWWTTWNERIEMKTSLTTLHFWDSVWRLPGKGRQSEKKRWFCLSASYPATPQTHPKCPPPTLLFSHLSLSSISHQELPPKNRDSRHQARNLRRLDLLSRMSQHHFQAQPVPGGRWTTWNHLNTDDTSR